MRRLYVLTLGIALTLWGQGCDDRSEVIARGRSGGDSASGGQAGASTGGAGGAAAGGEPSIERPRFTTVGAARGLNDPQAKDQDPTLPEDELEIFFFSDRGGNADIWRAIRADIASSWEAPVPVPELNSDKTEQNPAISRDGLRIWFSSSRDAPGLYYASRPSRDAAFEVPEAIPVEVSDTTSYVIAPSVDVTELRMAVSIGAAASRDLYELVRPSLTAQWGAPTPISGVNSESAESTPFLIEDGRELLFQSGRSGGGDLFWAYRESLGVPPVRIEPLSELNDPTGFDSHPHLSLDRLRLYFGSDRSGNTDIYIAE